MKERQLKDSKTMLLETNFTKVLSDVYTDNLALFLVQILILRLIGITKYTNYVILNQYKCFNHLQAYILQYKQNQRTDGISVVITVSNNYQIDHSRLMNGHGAAYIMAFDPEGRWNAGLELEKRPFICRRDKGLHNDTLFDSLIQPEALLALYFTATESCV
jgi:hypothetical protein